MNDSTPKLICPPVVCQSCHFVFPSRAFAVPSNGHYMVRNCEELCPRCGQAGRIAFFSSVDGEVLAQIQLPPSRAVLVATIAFVKQQIDENRPEQEIREDAAERFPWLKSLLGLTIGPGALWALLQLLVTLYMAIMNSYASHETDQIPNEQVIHNYIIDNFFETNIDELDIRDSKIEFKSGSAKRRRHRRRPK